MKSIAIAIALSLAAVPALAQNAAQVARAQAGASCPAATCSRPISATSRSKAATTPARG